MQRHIAGRIADSGCASSVSGDRFVIEKAGDGVNSGSCVMDNKVAIGAADGNRLRAVAGNGAAVIKSAH